MAIASTASHEEVAKFESVRGRLVGSHRPSSGPCTNLTRPGFATCGTGSRSISDAISRSRCPSPGSPCSISAAAAALSLNPMARLGFNVTGIDAAEKNVGVARVHAARSGLDIAYETATPEDFLARSHRYDIVIALEVVEHVADLRTFLEAASDLVATNGALIAATLNRTLKSLVMAKIGVEYILRWLPPGTHDWRKFVKPSELSAGLRRGGLTINRYIRSEPMT